MGSALSSYAYYFLFEYDTPKIVHIKSKLVGVINRIIQLVIIAYIIGWVIVYNHGYQEMSPLMSSVTTKVKGAVFTKHPNNINNIALTKAYDRVWDVADYVIPPQENGAFFVMTNAIITPNQTLGVNATLPVVNETICNPKHPELICTEGKTTSDSNCVMTGNCVKYDSETFTCEAHGWFPMEFDHLIPPYDKEPLLKGTEDFTVLIKNSISFNLWPKYRTRNILQATNNSSYLKTCIFDENNEFCPIFKLSTIVEKANENYTRLATQGGVMGIIINWDCNLDFDVNKCKPIYDFRRLDDPDVKIAPGWNFRFAHFYSDTNRTLYKAYGILFVVMVEGQGRKFAIVPLMLNVGSGLALLSIAVVVADIIVLYCTKKKDYYREKKYLIVNDSSDASGSDNEGFEEENNARLRDYHTFRRDSSNAN